ncbi:Crp/Fnr family transcriptional regulator [Xylanibacillus composti]|nr:Crp/Fnr family transcriptional regulator [Xylanibacillus composti]
MRMMIRAFPAAANPGRSTLHDPRAKERPAQKMLTFQGQGTCTMKHGSSVPDRRLTEEGGSVMDCFEAWMRRVDFFSELSAEHLSRIRNVMSERTYKKGTILFFEGDPGDELFIIKAGKVKVYRTGESKEVVLAYLFPGDYFGEMAVIQKDEARSATVEVTQKSTFYVLKQHDFNELIVQHPSICIHLLHLAMHRIRQSNEMIKDLTLLDASSRIYKTILRLADEYGVPKSEGVWINTRWTHQQIADLSGTVRETVTKSLLELQRENIISIEQKKIFIPDRRRLQEKVKHS